MLPLLLSILFVKYKKESITRSTVYFIFLFNCMACSVFLLLLTVCSNLILPILVKGEVNWSYMIALPCFLYAQSALIKDELGIGNI